MLLRVLIGAACVAGGLVLAGCQTGYGEMGLSGGVKSEQIGSDRYRITGLVNAYTPEPLLADFLMLKAAETTVSAGARYFVALDLQDSTRVDTYAVPGVANVVGNTVIYQPPSNSTVVSPKAYLTIRVFRGARPPNSVDAQEVIDTIGPRLKKGR